MKFGLHFLMSCTDRQTPAQCYRETIEQAVRGEALGFESVWPVEHHFDPSFSVMPCPVVLLAAIAARTRSLRLGTGIIQLALSNPLRVAEEIATLDVLSGGRVELGLGRGVNPSHFAGYNVSMAESRGRLEEGITFLRRAFIEDTFSFQGSFFRAEEVRLVPKPLQRAHPPMHLAANSLDTIELAGREGLPLILASHVNPFAKLPSLLAAYDAARRAAGHAPACADDLSLLMPIFVAEREEDIARTMAPSVERYVQVLATAAENLLDKCQTSEERSKLEAQLQKMKSTTFESVNGALGIFDTPSGCAARLTALRAELGVGRVIGWFNMGGLVSHESALASMDLFASRVMPALASLRAA